MKEALLKKRREWATHLYNFLCGIGGRYPTLRTSRIELMRFMETLHPLETQQGLIRLGAECDGGYLIPDDLDGIVACFSPGVSDCSDFELACAERGMPVFMADASVTSPATEHPLFSFEQKFVGPSSNCQTMTMDEWVSTSNAPVGGDLLLQMDIESAEYEVLFSISTALLSRFRIITIEFHRLGELWSLPYFKFVKRAFDRLLESHRCVHIHPNNRRGVSAMDGLAIPLLLEFTFYRKDRPVLQSHCTEFPHPLDRDNTERETLQLPRCWYR